MSNKSTAISADLLTGLHRLLEQITQSEKAALAEVSRSYCVRLQKDEVDDLKVKVGNLVVNL